MSEPSNALTSPASHRVRVYPDFDPFGPSIVWTEIFEVTDEATGNLVGSKIGTRHHPEVPLTTDELDAVLDALRYRRTGPWESDGDDGHEAPVSPANAQTSHETGQP